MAITMCPTIPGIRMAQTILLDATPRLVRVHLTDDRQSLLTLLRYNRVIEAFAGVPCYSFLVSAETHVTGLGCVHTDEVCMALDGCGETRIFAVQARGADEALDTEQVERDLAACAARFPGVPCQALGAQLVDLEQIALVDFVQTKDGVRIGTVKHYRLVTGDRYVSEDECEYLTSLA